MKINVEEKTENLLLNRQDITFQVDHTGSATPPRSDVRAKLAAILNCKEDQLYIIKLDGLYGQSTTQGYAHLYPSKEIALAQEQAHIIKRHPGKEPETKAPKEKKEDEMEADTGKPPKEEPPKKRDEKAPMKEEKEGKPKKEEAKKEEPKMAPKKEEKPTKEKPHEEKAEKSSEKK
jgi:small subunit ribosomal protein S24e